MLFGAYPFEDPEDPRNFRKTIGVSDYCILIESQSKMKLSRNKTELFSYTFSDMVFQLNLCGLLQRILSVQYSIPDYVRVSMECIHLLSRIFVANPEKVVDHLT